MGRAQRVGHRDGPQVMDREDARARAGPRGPRCGQGWTQRWTFRLGVRFGASQAWMAAAATSTERSRPDVTVRARPRRPIDCGSPTLCVTVRILVVSSYPPRHCGIGAYARAHVQLSKPGPQGRRPVAARRSRRHPNEILRGPALLQNCANGVRLRSGTHPLRTRALLSPAGTNLEGDGLTGTTMASSEEARFRDSRPRGPCRDADVAAGRSPASPGVRAGAPDFPHASGT